MSTTLDWRMKGALNALFEHQRWNILTIYILHSNRRSRAWCTQDYIKRAFGITPEVTAAARGWLVEHSALIEVPRAAYFGDEKKLPPRTQVFELTGRVVLDGLMYPYLFFGNTAEWDKESDNGPIPVQYSENPIIGISDHRKNRSEGITTSSEVNTTYGDVFVAILQFGFEADSKSAPKATKQRCGDAAKALLRDFPNVTPAEVTAFFAYWDREKKGLDKPKGSQTLPDNFGAWVKIGKPGFKPLIPVIPAGMVEHPTLPGKYITRQQYEQILKVQKVQNG